MVLGLLSLQFDVLTCFVPLLTWGDYKISAGDFDRKKSRFTRT